MIDFGALPPEINSTRMYAGPGPFSLMAAAVAWDALAAELHAAASCYRSVIAGLTTGRWLGPSSLTMASAYAPYMAWMAGAGARAAETAGQARLAVEVFEAAFAMTVPPPAVAANRAQLATLVATNFLGQNSAAIAATEAEYVEMWAQDAAAMYAYAAGSAAACEVTPFTPAPNVTNESGAAQQAAAVGKATSETEQANLANVVSKVPNSLHQLSSPMKVTADTGPDLGGTIGNAGSGAGDAANSSIMTGLASGIPGAIPSAFSAAATPLYGMSSILGIAQTAQGLAKAAGDGAMAAASGAASAASSGAGALGSLGSGIFGSLGKAAMLGPLAVPASWTSVIPAAHSAVSALPAINLAGANVPPSVMGSLPRLAAASGKNLGPRYGVIPTVMTRPLSAGYA
ncbi:MULTISPECIES: PPE family protein [Mycobacterium]|uniref:PPE family protein n=1 Tax=Mycobacterium TaxID=1763 RepID=UPI001DBE4036|nr:MULTISPECIES: PPE family protein [Mycobacterium]MCA2243964.1 PPE family protein [Mycobacterium sp. WUMAC-067]MCA2314812.1 PPE family protein [Mycobacterium sp. WUMAC-025]MEE3753715.1 PPE family protein [Mycobacterium intracellulare]